jgi:hypothetical protein
VESKVVLIVVPHACEKGNAISRITKWFLVTIFDVVGSASVYYMGCQTSVCGDWTVVKLIFWMLWSNFSTPSLSHKINKEKSSNYSCYGCMKHTHKECAYYYIK